MKQLKLTAAFFFAYSISVGIPLFLYIGFSFGVGDAYGDAPPQTLNLFLETGYWIVVALGTPLIPVYLLIMHALDLRGNAAQLFTVYVFNGILLASIASVWVIRKNATSNATHSIPPLASSPTSPMPPARAK